MGPVRTLRGGPEDHLPGDRISHGDGHIAMGAGPSEPDPGHEGPAVLAPLLADRTGAARGALVDGQGPASWPGAGTTTGT